jgi:coenzyme F420-reducing hydrogenase delta subunit/NADH:ubiquinone oxidoreductase subunit E
MAAGHEFEPRILGFLCNWCCYAGADLAGVSRFQYPPNIRVIRVMCSGRVDPAHIFRAFSTGQDAVFIGGCHLNDCHYVTHGNYNALSMVYICKKLLEHIGLNPERLRIEWVSAGEGIRFASIMNEFSPKIEKLGPLGNSEGIDEHELKFKLEAVTKLIPYIKLVQSERLRVPVRTEEAYNKFFTSEEFNRLFNELIADKLAESQIMALLREKPHSPGEISKILGLSPSEVSRYLHVSARNQNISKAAVDNKKIDRIINKHQRKAGSLVQVLLEIQHENHWLPLDILDRVSKKLNVPLSRVMQIVTFHKTFSLIPKGRNEVHVCTGPSCYVRGSTHLLDSLQDLIGIKSGETDPDSKFSLETGNCLGCCNLGPEIIVNGKHHGRVTPDKVKDVLKNYE